MFENSVKQGTPKKRKLSSNSSNRGKLEDIEFEEMPPKITINYRHLENDGYSEGQSQDDNFSDIEYNGASNFEAQHKYQDETHSEQRARPYSRHNTPNFDTFSQKKINQYLALFYNYDDCFNHIEGLLKIDDSQTRKILISFHFIF